MKLLACALLALELAPPSSLAQGTPIPPGIRQADRAEEQAQRDLPPPAPPHARIDLVELREDADDLARLSQTIPADVASMQRGILPKDMLDKLKRIEKVSKKSAARSSIERAFQKVLLKKKPPVNRLVAQIKRPRPRTSDANQTPSPAVSPNRKRPCRCLRGTCRSAVQFHPM